MIKKIENRENLKDETFLEFLLRNIKVGGWGGVVQILVVFVAWVILMFSNLTFSSAIWNVCIINIPITIDIFSMLSKVPRELTNKYIRRLHETIAILLSISVIAAIIFIGLILMNMGNNYFNNFISVMKWSIGLSVIGGIMKYSCEIILEVSRSRKIRSKV